ncbi:MAG: hypothetical protein ACKO9H_05285, partial [Planctomycetota bacterium]
MLKTLDQKLTRIAADSACRDFILADAKDPDMGFGISAPGLATRHSRPGRRYRSLAEFRQSIREIVQQGLVDIMLMSASTSEQLTVDEKLFANSSVTPAARANDTTDIWCGQTGSYKSQPSLSLESIGETPRGCDNDDRGDCGESPARGPKCQTPCLGLW